MTSSTTALRAASWRPAFYSAYRLTLRALSAAVRHHQVSLQNLRGLYRPSFRNAALIYSRHEIKPTQETEDYLCEWNERLDRTLSILHMSANSAGQCNKLVRGLARLTDAYRTRVWLDATARQKMAGTWNGQDITLNTRNAPKPGANLTERDRVQLMAWSALGELVVAAETDLRIHCGLLEARVLPFKRLTVPRRTPAGHSKNLRTTINLVGKKMVRPKELRVV